MEPSQSEAFAYEVVRRLLDVTIEHRDTQTADRQGSVDAHIHYPDGRTGALEVSLLTLQSDMQMQSILARWTGRGPTPAGGGGQSA